MSVENKDFEWSWSNNTILDFYEAFYDKTDWKVFFEKSAVRNIITNISNLTSQMDSSDFNILNINNLFSPFLICNLNKIRIIILKFENEKDDNGFPYQKNIQVKNLFQNKNVKLSSQKHGIFFWNIYPVLCNNNNELNLQLKNIWKPFSILLLKFISEYHNNNYIVNFIWDENINFYCKYLYNDTAHFFYSKDANRDTGLFDGKTNFEKANDFFVKHAKEKIEY